MLEALVGRVRGQWSRSATMVRSPFAGVHNLPGLVGKLGEVGILSQPLPLLTR